MHEDKELAKRIETAQFRFGLIAPAIQGTHREPSDTAYYKALAAIPVTLPDGSTYQYNYKTYQKWVSLYKSGGIDALMPSGRSDKGIPRALPDEAVAEIFRLKEEFPRLNATQIHQKLIRDGFLPATVSVCAVQRFIKRNDLKSARNPNIRDRKAFEEDAFGKMWQADSCYFPHITEDGKSRRVYCVMIIDDHSRMIVGGELFYHDDAAGFQKVFRDAVSTYNIPDKLLVDNGAPYTNEQLSLICGSIGTSLIHTRPRDGASKGKCERNWRTAKERFVYALDINTIHSLEQFNSLLRDYIRQYNLTFHTGIQCTPFERFQATKDHPRTPKSKEWLEECFLNRIYRKVRKDATVSIGSVSYDVPMQFISARVEIRYRPGDMDSAFILYDGKQYLLIQTDKVANCHTKRQNAPTIDYGKAGASHV